jgi:hypothetical protein
MLRTLVLFLVIAAAGKVWAQSEVASPMLLGATEIHCGVSTQSLVYLGVRQFIADQLFAEVGFGSVPKYDESVRAFFGHTLGLGFTPHATQYNGNGLFYTLLYTFVAEEFLSSERDYHHLLTANIGYITQREDEWSFVVRLGGGIFQRNSLNQFYYEDTPIANIQKSTSLIFPYEDTYVHELFPWLNLEVAVGFAF